MKKLKLGKAAIFALFFCLLVIPVKAHACEGSSATGAELPDYDTVVKLYLDETEETDSMSQQLADALDVARENASNRVQYKIIVPPGNYELVHCFEVASNTLIYAKGVVWEKTSNEKQIFKTKSNKTYKNFVLNGGVWDSSGSDTEYMANASLVYLAHIRNFIIKNATFMCKRGGHIIEVGDVKGMTITGCTLTGNYLNRSLQPKEAIQLDICTETAMKNLKPYNGKGCHNIVISNNNIYHASRGVGSHSDGEEANSYTNITVKDNRFSDLKGQAVYGMFWKNCTVKDNTIVNVYHSGIWCSSARKIVVKDNTVRGVASFTGQREKQYSANQVGVLLTNTVLSTVKNNLMYNKDGFVVKKQGTCKKITIKGNKQKK